MSLSPAGAELEPAFHGVDVTSTPGMVGSPHLHVAENGDLILHCGGQRRDRAGA